MSLRDATKKMSKSDINDYSRINITDDVSIIFDKIKKSKTDSLGRVKLIFIYIYKYNLNIRSNLMKNKDPKYPI